MRLLSEVDTARSSIAADLVSCETSEASEASEACEASEAPLERLQESEEDLRAIVCTAYSRLIMFHFAVLEFRATTFESDGCDYGRFVAQSMPLLHGDGEDHNQFQGSAEAAVQMFTYVEPFLGDVNACTKQEVIDACLDFSFSNRGSRGCAVQMADDLWAGEVEGPLALRVIECYSSRICGEECCVVPGY